MNGQTGVQVQYPLPAGALAIYNGSTPTYAHGDWLGSGRLVTSSTQMMVADSAYAPFGEQYSATGSFYNFTGQEQWTTSGLDDFLFRRYHPVQGRWISPDPAGLAAVDITNPQTWNRYAYVANNPLKNIDPKGLYLCNSGDDGGDPVCDGEGDGGGGGGDGSDPQVQPDPLTLPVAIHRIFRI
jgi:RHS repeat-associated protein